jgi:hypothetical protein
MSFGVLQRVVPFRNHLRRKIMETRRRTSRHLIKVQELGGFSLCTSLLYNRKVGVVDESELQDIVSTACIFRFGCIL